MLTVLLGLFAASLICIIRRWLINCTNCQVYIVSALRLDVNSPVATVLRSSLPEAHKNE